MSEVVGVLHPGAMGAVVGSVLRGRGHQVWYAAGGRSAQTLARAAEAGLADAGTAREVAARCDVLLSICPPHAALDVAREVAGFAGVYVDANAVSPRTAREIAGVVEAGGAAFVDGGIVGGPPRQAGTTRLYLSGPRAAPVAALFAGTALDARCVGDQVGDASAVKMCYAAWTKGSAALLLAIAAAAEELGVAGHLAAEWRLSLPELPAELAGATRAAAAKGWRWVAEMEQIAATFGAAGQPAGFHRAAAEMYSRHPRPDQG